MDDGTEFQGDTRETRMWRGIAIFALALLLLAIAVVVAFATKGLTETYSVVTGILVNFVSSMFGFLVAAQFVRRPPKSTDSPSTAENLKKGMDALLVPVRESIQTLEERLSNQLRSGRDDEHRPLLNEISKLAAIIQDQTRHRVLGQIPWPSLLAGASEVDFVVQGWDRWVDDHESSLKELFERGGRFRLYIYDPQSDKNSVARFLMAERLGKTPNDVTVEINGTTARLKAIRDDLAPEKRSQEQLTIFQTTKFNWYFAARFQGKKYPSGGSGRDVIVFSIYSHTKHKVAKMPAIMLYPDENEEMARWFQAELDHLGETRAG